MEMNHHALGSIFGIFLWKYHGIPWILDILDLWMVLVMEVSVSSWGYPDLHPFEWNFPWNQPARWGYPHDEMETPKSLWAARNWRRSPLGRTSSRQLGVKRPIMQPGWHWSEYDTTGLEMMIMMIIILEPRMNNLTGTVGVPNSCWFFIPWPDDPERLLKGGSTTSQVRKIDELFGALYARLMRIMMLISGYR